MRMLSDGPAVVHVSVAPVLVTPASASAEVGGFQLEPPARGAAGGGGGGSFDGNMVIILAALLCVIVCALGLNFLIRCASHCCGRRAVVTVVAAPPAAASAAAAARATDGSGGIDKRALGRMPVEVYEAKGAGGSAIPGTECAICLGDFDGGDEVRVLPGCHHGFHVRCIDMWLAGHSSCPICRSSLAPLGCQAPA